MMLTTTTTTKMVVMMVTKIDRVTTTENAPTWESPRPHIKGRGLPDDLRLLLEVKVFVAVPRINVGEVGLPLSEIM